MGSGVSAATPSIGIGSILVRRGLFLTDVEPLENSMKLPLHRVRLIAKVAVFRTLLLNLANFGIGVPKIILGRQARVYQGDGSRIHVDDRLSVSVTSHLVEDAKTYLELLPNSQLKITGSAELGNGSFVRVNSGALLQLGDGVVVRNGVRISSSTTIKIGSGTMVGFDATIMDDDYHSIIVDGVETETNGPITIGENVWIASRVMVLKGVKIGDNSVIAAGTIVTGDVRPNVLVGGSPMRVLRENITWKR